MESNYSPQIPPSAKSLSTSLLEKAINEAIAKNKFPSNEDEAEKALEQYGTNAERIRHYYEIMKEQHSMLPQKVAVKFEKNENLANAALKKSNEAPHYVTALEAYNEALCLAPPGSTAMAFAYAGRSLIYAETGFYRFALQNIESALKNSCTEELKLELDERKEVSVAQKKKNKDSYEIYGSIEEIELSYTNNQQIPAIVDGMECEYDDVYGRHIVTHRNLTPGDIVSLEDPFITAPCRLFQYKSCYNCSAHNFFNLIPCPNSTSAMFCSETCIDEAWKRYYKYEHPIIDGLLDYVNNNFAVRATFKAFTAFENADKLMKLINPGPANVFECDFQNADERTKFRLFNSLITNEARRSKLDTLKIVYSCATVLHMVKEWTEFKSVLEDEKLETLFLELLMRFQQIQYVNNYNVFEPFRRSYRDKLIQFSHRGMGDGNYLVSSLFAHSCAPNAVMFPANQRGKLGILVIHPIKAGDIIFISYGPTFVSYDRISRQSFLKTRYQFDCQCVACEDVDRFPINIVWSLIMFLDYGPPFNKISAAGCLFDDKAQVYARQVRKKVSTLITSEIQENYPCTDVIAYETSLLDAIHILVFRKPMDLIFQKRKQQGFCSML